MDITLTILIPVLMVVLLIAIIMIPWYIVKQNKKSFDFLSQNLELTRLQLHENRKQEKEKAFGAVSLQAYERLVLFLERIKPANLITRVMKPHMTSFTLSNALLHSIKEEYEHNMSQQLYISGGLWELVKTAKEDIIMLINTSAEKIDRGAPGADLAKEILTKGVENESNPIDKVMQALKEEVRKNFD